MSTRVTIVRSRDQATTAESKEATESGHDAGSATAANAVGTPFEEGALFAESLSINGSGDGGITCTGAGDPTLGVDAGASCTGALAAATFTYGGLHADG